MSGIEERVREFLDSWHKVKEHLEKLTEDIKEDEGLFHGDRTCRSLPGESEDDLSKAMG
jgi:hypothetical protein